jgi:hypothetical protein
VGILRASRQGHEGRPASSPWTAPPPEPAPYRLHTRLSDIAHGWLDGRHGIPELPASMARAASETRRDPDRPEAGGGAGPQAERPAGPGSPESLPLPLALWTPRMEVLSRQALERIEGERIGLHSELAVLQREWAGFQAQLDGAADQVATAEHRLGQACQRLSEPELDERRLAEQDPQRRPAALVRARRQAAWDRRLSMAQQDYLTLALSSGQARQEAALREELLRGRTQVARAAAQRHHELALRRIATYLQQLVRTHRRGGELNRLLVQYRVGPGLPQWTREVSDEAGH